MLGSIRAISSRGLLKTRSFATTRSVGSNDLSRLTLIGYLVRDPEARLTKNDKEYVTYTVATRNNPPPPSANGERAPSTSTFHRITSFREASNNYLRTLKKGSKVYVEAGFELKEPEPDADPSTPRGQRQIFLRHEHIRVVQYKADSETESSTPSAEESENFPSGF